MRRRRPPLGLPAFGAARLRGCPPSGLPAFGAARGTAARADLEGSLQLHDCELEGTGLKTEDWQARSAGRPALRVLKTPSTTLREVW